MALADNLVSYWQMGNANDSHGTNHLTNNNSVSFTTGKVGNAGDFENGSNHYLSIASNNSLRTGDIDFTLTCWVRMESKSQAGGIVGKGAAIGTTTLEYLVEYVLTSDCFRFLISDGSSLVVREATTLGSPSTATWYFIVSWHDSVNNTLNIQVNDGNVDSTAHSTGVALDTEPFEIGRASATSVRDFDGLIDEVGFWKRVLTSDERTDLYNSGNGRNYAYIIGTMAGLRRHSGSIWPTGAQRIGRGW